MRFLPLLLLLAACDDPAREATSTAPPVAAEAAPVVFAGEAVYRERVLIPPGAVLTVRLIEAESRAPVADTSFVLEAGGPPFAFVLEVPGERLAAAALLALTAGLAADGMAWSTPEPVPVDPDGLGGVELELRMHELHEPVSTAHYDEARAAGVTFRGVGQEPGWLVNVYGAAARPDSLGLVLAYGEDRFTLTDVRHERLGGRTVYRAEAPGGSVTLEIRDEACFDGMSGEPFPAAVTLRLPAEELRGCGRPL